MKRTLAIILCICLALSLSACQLPIFDPEEGDRPQLSTQPSVEKPKPTDEATQPQTPPLPLTAASMPVIQQTLTAKDGTQLFQHTFQSVTLMLENPETVKAVTEHLTAQMDAANAEAAHISEKAKSEYSGSSDWTPYQYSVTYNPARLDRVVFSLLGTYAVYDGNAHPSQSHTSFTYHLISGSPLTLRDVLADHASQDQLIQLIQKALASYGDSLFGDYPYVVEDGFEEAQGYPDNWYLSDAGLCFYYAPYEIAPYSLGTVIAEIPYEKLLGVLSEEYFPPETVLMSGTVRSLPLSDAALAAVQQYAEVVLDPEGTEFLLTTDGTVRNIRMETGYWTEKTFVPQAQVFAAEVLTDDYAIVVQTAIPEDSPVLRLIYTTGDQEICAYVTQDAADGAVQLSTF